MLRVMLTADLIDRARRVYDLHRRSDANSKAYQRRRLGPIPTWERLDDVTREQLMRRYAALARCYDAGRDTPTETKIGSR